MWYRMLRNILSMTVFRWIHSDKRLHIRFVLSYISVSPLRQTPHILGYYLLRIFWYILRMSWKSSLFLLLLLSLTELRRNLRHQLPDNLIKRDWKHVTKAFTFGSRIDDDGGLLPSALSFAIILGLPALI